MRTEHCHYCYRPAENYDYLTQTSYCSDCHRAVLETPEHVHFNHVHKRLLGRYGMQLTIGLYHEARNAIKFNYDKTFVCNGSQKPRSIHSIKLQGKKVYLVFDTKNQALISALPRKLAQFGGRIV